MSQVQCPECDASIELPANVVAGEVVGCGDCGVELEIVSSAPLRVQLAPEVAEDWGE